MLLHLMLLTMTTVMAVSHGHSGGRLGVVCICVYMANLERKLLGILLGLLVCCTDGVVTVEGNSSFVCFAASVDPKRGACCEEGERER